jgi:malate dehydrogenase
MSTKQTFSCKVIERERERDRIGVWGFGAVSRDVVLSLIHQDMGKEVVFYSRPKGDFQHRAEAWIDDIKANVTTRPRLVGTSDHCGMAGLDVIFIGVGVPRRPGMTRDDLLSVNTEVIARTCLQIKELYTDCAPEDLPILVFMGNPVTCMTWVGWKASGFPRANIMGQAGNLDTRRICQAISGVLGLSGHHVNGVLFGDHGDSMVADPRFFSVNGIPLLDYLKAMGVDPGQVDQVIDSAKKGGTHFVNEVGSSASAGPAKAACEMLRCIIKGEREVQPVIAILEEEYGLIDSKDPVKSLGFGVPARIGPLGIEDIIMLPVEPVREQMLASAANIKGNIEFAAKVLKEKLGIE